MKSSELSNKIDSTLPIYCSDTLFSFINEAR